MFQFCLSFSASSINELDFTYLAYSWKTYSCFE